MTNAEYIRDKLATRKLLRVLRQFIPMSAIAVETDSPDEGIQLSITLPGQSWSVMATQEGDEVMVYGTTFLMQSSRPFEFSTPLANIGIFILMLVD
jgi:hypothetical protein